jgi:hypothetical protein
MISLHTQIKQVELYVCIFMNGRIECLHAATNFYNVLTTAYHVYINFKGLYKNVITSNTSDDRKKVHKVKRVQK